MLFYPLEEAAAQTDAAVVEPAPPPQQEPVQSDEGFFDKFFDDQDGKLDFSKILAGGGFVPVPVIITEPAVDGGFGVVAQFVTASDDDPQDVTRRMLGAVKTRNGSYGYGYFQSGHAMDGRISYKFGVGRGKITLTTYPEIAPDGIEYTNHYDYGMLGSVLWHLPDERFSIGPTIDFRKLETELDIEGLPEAITDRFGRTLHTRAIGAGFHFDSRDNVMTPTKGVNAFVEGKFNLNELGSDREFQTYDLSVYAFHKFSPEWRLGAKAEVDAARGDYPIFFAPAINLRGVEASHYQGATVLSTEVEVTKQLSSRWSVLAFAGFGMTDAGGSRLFDNSGAIFAGGGGFRYRIARALGLDAGIDLAVGPGGAVVYLQFGHAWAFGMD